ncbi:hypothetical protein J121_1941 [Qipengyuania citrea LAMA 915]|uniref:Uncharacterized protein n=1 Tax=Qipengyuania citrea LAMA 915 TaxID=1306953 RepID=A0A0L1KHV1_9SPHN|nr:hypothetical protein J121_1941 [Qipengyuania citrea LAMA 915]
MAGPQGIRWRTAMMPPGLRDGGIEHGHVPFALAHERLELEGDTEVIDDRGCRLQ